MRRFCVRAALAATLAAAVLPAVFAPVPAYAEGGMRPEVGKPLAKAKSLFQAHRYGEAMAQVRIAASQRGLTEGEQTVIEELRGAIAQTSGDFPTAIHSFKYLLDSGKVPASEQVRLWQALASMAYQTKQWPQAIAYTAAYFKAGGTDPDMRALPIQAYYQQGDYASAARIQAAQIAQTIKAGRRPTEGQLQLLADCQRHDKDQAGFNATMVELVTYYPKLDYWENLIHDAQIRPGFSDRLNLDIQRFQLVLGLIAKPADYMEMTEVALQVPLPGEAKAIIDQGYAKGVLGTGAEAPRQKRLADLVAKTYADDLKLLPAQERDASGDHDGNRLLTVGEEYVSYGQLDHGISLMLTAMQKDQLRHPEEAKLQLGLAYLKSGQKPVALKTLRSVGGNDGAADIAKLWVLYTTVNK
jgi:tetratricopeptide (TPR) repeat protein